MYFFFRYNFEDRPSKVGVVILSNMTPYHENVPGNMIEERGKGVGMPFLYKYITRKISDYICLYSIG